MSPPPAGQVTRPAVLDEVWEDEVVGKSARTRTASNAKLAAIKAEQARKDRRRKVLLASGVIVVVLAVAAAIVVASRNSPAKAPTTASALDPTAFKNLTSVPGAAFNTVGVGSAAAAAAPAKVDAPALTKDGKPRVVYVGAEYCPFCASERWALTVALSRFGTWSTLAAASSSPEDTYPSTPTVSFHGATYTSDYLSFTGYETSTNKIVNGVREKLDTLSPEDETMF
ncbi:MAG TPA: DUF929 family protein, partial [Candidatus Lustribacter sp.]|nr:DUF929 family protein [Candidatus Lustribacter sp.]